jgi:hypothetical protein
VISAAKCATEEELVEIDDRLSHVRQVNTRRVFAELASAQHVVFVDVDVPKARHLVAARTITDNASD